MCEHETVSETFSLSGELSCFFSDIFGLFHVDFNDPDRKTGKKSAEVYSQINKSNKIPVELLNVEISQ